ncbi:MAG TPA: DNA primase [Chloroflexota bacterium]
MDAVAEVKDRLAIEDVVGRYVELRRSGASLKGLCPFHQEKTPSFYVTPARGTYHCFGCGKGGDVLSFVMEIERLPFPEALQRLAGQAGVALPERTGGQVSLNKQIYDANDAAVGFFKENLFGPQGDRARNYLLQRGFEPDAWALFELGYAPDTREALIQHLRSKGIEDRLILAAGLGMQDTVGGRARDRFRGRLMFPIKDRAGRICGFGGRVLGDEQPKYLNSPQTDVFDKSAVLFGIHRAQSPIREGGRAVLVEGYLDALRAHVAGFDNVVASLGTAVTPQQLGTLSRLASTVVLALDPDAAGQAAAARAGLNALAEVLQNRGNSAAQLDLRVARLPENGGDPDELIRDNRSSWSRLIDHAIPAFEYYFEQTMAGLDRSGDGWRQQAIDRLLPLIQQFSSSAGWQALWLQRLSQETGVDPRALQRSLPSPTTRAQRKRERSSDQGKDVVNDTTARALGGDPGRAIEQSLLALLFKIVVVPEHAASVLVASDLQDGTHRALLEALLKWRSTDNYDFDMFRRNLPSDLQNRADELHELDVPLPSDGVVSVAISLHLARLKYFRLQAQLTRASQTLQDLAPDDRATAVAGLAPLMQQRQELEQALNTLSQRAMQSGSTG